MTSINHKNIKTLSCLVIFALSGTLLLTGCANMEATEKKAQANYGMAESLADKAALKQDDNLIHFKDDIFIAGESFQEKPKTKPLPSIFNEEAGYSSNKAMTLHEIIRDLSKQSGVTIRLTEDAKTYLTSDQSASGNQASQTRLPIARNQQQSDHNQEKTLVLYYEGDFKGLLDEVTAHFGLWWLYDDENNHVSIYRYETQTFKLDMLLEFTQTKKTIKNTTANDVSPQSMSTEFDTGNDKPWENTVTTLRSLIGENGVVEPSPVSGIITVRTTPSLMRSVKQYIDALNDIVTQRIAIKVDIYDVQHKASSNYGLNWDAVYQSTKGVLEWNTSNIATALPNPFSSNIQTATLSGGIDSGKLKGSNFIFSALQQIGKTTYVKGQTAYTVNGHPTAVNISESIAYVKEKSVTTLGGDSSNNVQASIVPGTIDTGFYLTFRPKIIANNEVLLSLSVDMSSLLDMRESKSGSGENASYVELPSVQSKTFSQALPVQSGQSFILGAFRNQSANTGTNSIGDESKWWAGGNKATAEDHTMTVIVVTPYIMGRS
ncbi:hypothetical protein [Cysteiniphilum marinum]|uniref:hypothetical protein n=1 Tax=Cysteiniphilum marinum TaxID=2774191 RepID=UPI00193C5719|nr:hypothetical protein [Cysteiniphilum marinum]